MASRIASLRLQLIDSVSGPAKAAAGAMRNLEKNLAKMGRDGVPGAQRLGRQLDWLKQKSQAAFTFNTERRELTKLYKDFREARSNVARISETLAIASKEPKKFAAAINVLKRDLTGAQSQLRASTAAFNSQKAAVKGAEQALRLYGINGARAAANAQRTLRDQMAQTIRQIRALDRETRANAARPAATRGAGVHPERGVAGAVVGGMVANVGRSAAQRGFAFAVEFDKEAQYQKAIGDFSTEQKARLNKQAEEIGKETRFTNADVVRAQTKILQSGIRGPETIMNLTRQVTDYALAMNVTLEEAAETVAGAALSKRVDIGDVGKIRNFIDFLVWMSKNSGMSDEDVRQYMKYAGASTTGAGLPDTYAAAIGMVLRRSGVRGDEAGVFARSAAGKLVAPTNKGRTALTALGIDFNDFVKMPDAMNTRGIGVMMKTTFGKEIPEAMRKRIEHLLAEGEFVNEDGETVSVASDAGEFNSQMSKILAPLFGGKSMKPKDAKALNDALSAYWKNSIESIDVVGLFEAIMQANPSLANLNSIFTEKQGGRANMIAQQWALFSQFVKMMEEVPGGVASKIGKEANEGLYGDWTRMVGNVETALLRIVQDWEGPLRKSITTVDAVMDGFLNLSDGTRKLVEAFLAAAAVFGAYAAGKGAMGVLGGVLGGGAAGAAAGGAAKGGVFKRLLGGGAKAGGAAGLAWMLLSVLGESDESGTLWGVLDGPNEFIKKQTGYDPAKNEWVKTPTQRHNDAVSGAKQAEVEQSIKPLDDAIASWPAKAQSAMMDYGQALVDGGADAEAKAAAAATAIKAELSFTAHPDINTGAFERALALARQVAGAIRTIEGGGGGSYQTPPNSNPTFGGPRRHGGDVKKGRTYLVGEAGPEPFTPNANGRITSHEDAFGQRGGIHMPVTVRIAVNGASAADLRRVGEEAANAVVSALNGALGRGLSRSSQVAFSSTRYGDA